MMQLLTFSPPARTMLRTVVFALCGFLCTAHALADTFQIDGNTYKTTSDNTCSLTKGSDVAEVVVPQDVTYSGQTYTVTEIGKEAFYYCSNLTSIELPNTIKTIGNSAFQSCSSLQNIVIPDSVSYIGSYAFYYCKSLSKINIPDGITSIENGTFDECYNLDSITIPNSVTTIGDYAFTWCSRLTTVNLPDALADIGRYAFYACSRMAALEISQSVTTIGDFAFSSCSALNSVVIPKSVTTIGDGCFGYCYNLKEIQVESENKNYQSVDGVLFNKDLTTLYCYPYRKEGDQYKVPNSVTMIDTIAFCGSRLLQTVQIPAATSRIRGNVFRYSDQLKAIEVAAGNSNYQSVDGILFDKGLTTLYVYPKKKEGTEYTIPSSVTSIEEYAFCKANLESIKIPESVTNIGKYAFYQCYNLHNIELPNTLTTIGEGAFEHCSKLFYVKIPESVTTIGNYAFCYCSKLTAVEIPSSVTTIGYQAFDYCPKLTAIACYATSPIKTFGSSTFDDDIYTSATLYVPEASIAAYQSSSYIWSKFQNIKSLSEYTVPIELPATVYDDNGICYYISEDGVCSVQKGVDEATVTIPQEITYSDKIFTVTEIGKEAFYRCSNLSSIELPNTIKTIGNYAFYSCSSLQNIVIPDSVSYIGRYAFYYCKSLSKINIPDGITSIEYGTFDDCYNLDSITIPNTVTTIGDYAFAWCSSLTTVNLPDALTDIGRYAFYDCYRMAALEIPQSVTTIGDFAFYYCSALNSVVVPKSVKTIGDGCFGYCVNLKEIQVESENSNYQSADGILFNKELTTLYCYPGGKEDEQYTVPNSVTTIDTTAFYNCNIQTVQIPAATSRIRGNAFRSGKLKSIEVATENEHFQSVDGVLFDKELKTLCIYPRQKDVKQYTIPSSVTSIEKEAFYYASKLVLIKVPESVTTIGAYAFYSCSSLSKIDIPNSINSIEQSTFAWCYGLSKIKIPESVISIASSAFYYCKGLKCVEIKSSVATIGSYAFYGCDSLTDVVCYATEPITAQYSWTFSTNTYASATLYVPDESIAAYQSTSYCWSKFQNIKPLSEYVTYDDEDGEDSYLSDAGTVYAEPGKPFVFYMKLLNLDERSISDLTYDVLIDGMEAQPGNATFGEPIDIASTRYVGIRAVAPQVEAGTALNGKVKITGINGDSISMKSAGVTVAIRNFAPQKRPLVEDYTGTWCGWCPRGWVAMEALGRDYPDALLKVAYHSSDAMAVSTMVKPVPVTSYPTTHLNRTNFYAQTILTTAFTTMNEPAIADVQMTAAAWDDENYSDATCRASVLFDRDVAAGEYRVEFVLVEDSLQEVGSGWFQATNYYSSSGEWDDPLWDNFTNANSAILNECYVPNLMFNDVCLANSLADEAYSPYLPATAALDTIALTYTFKGINSITGAYRDVLLKHPGSCRLAIIVTRADDGTFVNCAWMNVGDAENSSGVQSVLQDAANGEAVIYDLNGARIYNSREHLAPGIYVVRQGGKSHKVLIK